MIYSVDFSGHWQHRWFDIFSNFHWQQRSEILSIYPRRFLINFLIFIDFLIFDFLINFLIFSWFPTFFLIIFIFSYFIQNFITFDDTFRLHLHVYIFTESYWQQWFFIYSVTASFIYSVKVTTSESTVNCWKPTTSDIFTDSDNNHLAGTCITQFNYNTVLSRFTISLHTSCEREIVILMIVLTYRYLLGTVLTCVL